jgi:uncharacterized protein (DUF305 family)
MVPHLFQDTSIASLKVMTAPARTAARLAAIEARAGSLPAIRQLARQLLVEQQARIATLHTPRHVWSKPHASRQ